MKKTEQERMESLLASFTSQKTPEGLTGASPDELEKRIRVLHLGFEIRTRSVLEREFPRFHLSLSPVRWKELGQNFTRTEASSVEQLGLLPHKFYVAMKEQGLETSESSALEKDYLEFQCRHAKLLSPLLHLDLESLTEDSILKLQPTVFIQLQESKAWVVSRSRNIFFEEEVSLETASLLLKLQENPKKILAAIDILKTDQELSRFFVTGIRNYWLQAPNRS